MKLLVTMQQIINNQTLETLKQSISKIIIQAKPHIQTIKQTQVKVLGQKVSQLNTWYMKMTGLDKVYLAQEKVTYLQDHMLKIQEKRRDVGKQLSEVRQKSIELQDEIHLVKRQEDLERFLDLMQKETKVLKLEKSISRIFQEYDQAERELFTAFIDSIRDSHEKQRAQMEYTKYLSITLSIVGSFLGFIYSTLKKEQLKQIINENLQIVNQTYGAFTSQLIDSNKSLVVEVAANRKVLEAFYAVMTKKLSVPIKLYREGTNSVDFIDKNDKDESSASPNYLKIVGIIIGLCLISKIFTG